MGNNILIGSLSQYKLVIKLPSDATVLTAAKLMSEHNIGAIMVVDQDDLVGIFSERDLVKRVAAKGLAPEKTQLREVMTTNPVTLSHGDNLQQAMDLMTQHRFRHLPIKEEGKITGMVSLRDLFGAIYEDMRDNINKKDAILFGESYGIAA